LTVEIKRNGRKIELSMLIPKTKVYNAAEVWEDNGYVHVDPQDIENYKEIKWKGIEFNRLVSKGGKLYRFNGWVGLYPYARIEIEEIGTIH